MSLQQQIFGKHHNTAKLHSKDIRSRLLVRSPRRVYPFFRMQEFDVQWSRHAENDIANPNFVTSKFR